jgi:hypothetical protein
LVRDQDGNQMNAECRMQNSEFRSTDNGVHFRILNSAF